MNTSKLTNLCSVLAFTLITLISCESDTDGYVSLSEDLNLSAVEYNGKVKLKWTLTKLNNFQEYRVYRSKSASGYYQNNPIFTTSDFFNNTFIDENPNALGINYYWVDAIERAGGNYEQRRMSTIDSVRIGNYDSFSYFPTSVIFDKETNLIGFVDSHNKFTLYNYSERKVIAEKEVNRYLRYPCFGKYQGQTELYISENNSSSLSVFDLNTMNKKASIALSQYQPYSIAVNGKGKIYVSTHYRDIEVLNRDQSAVYSVSSSYDPKYLYYSQNMNMLLANEDDSYGQLYRYNADTEGDIDYNNSSYTYLSGYHYPCFKEDPYGGNIHVMPNGRILNPSNGSFEYSVFGNSQDVSFSSSYVYVAPFGQKSIYTYERSGAHVNTIDIPGYPIYTLIDDNTLIVLFVEDSVSVSQAGNNRHYKGYDSETAFGIFTINL